MPRPARAPRIDGALTRIRLVEAGGELVAAHGFAAMTGKAIAEAAGVDLASINYHFGSRNGLYQAVLVEAHRRLITLPDLQRISASGRPGADKLRQVVEMLVAGSGEGQGWHTRVLARELLAPSPHLQVLFQEEVQPKFAVMRQIVGEITGIPEDDPALLRCLVNVAAPCAMLLVIGPSMPGPFQDVLHGSRQALVRDLQAFLLGGLRALSRTGKAPAA
jgi:AcrR family transcriptional regulator